MAVLHSGNDVGRIDEVTLRRARLAPAWVTVFGWANRLRMQLATQANSASYLNGTGHEYQPQCGHMLCGSGVMAGTHYTHIHRSCLRAVNADREHGRHFWPPVNTARVCTCDTLVTTTARVHGSDVNKDLTCKANAKAKAIISELMLFI